MITCPGIFPTAFTILWRRQSKAAAIVSPVLGMATGLAVWLGSAYSFFGEVTVASTGEVLPCLYGTVAAALSPIPYTVIITLFKPQNFDWADFAAQRLAFEKLDENLTTTVESRTVDAEAAHAGVNRQELKRWGRIAAFWAVATFFGHWVLWPLPMYASHYIFGRSVRTRHSRSVCLRKSFFC